MPFCLFWLASLILAVLFSPLPFYPVIVQLSRCLFILFIPIHDLVPYWLFLGFFSQELVGNNVEGVLVIKHPWPSIARTVNGDHKRYLETYMKVNNLFNAPLSSPASQNEWWFWFRCCMCFFSLTLVSSTLVMEPLVMSMDTSGSRVVLMVRLLFSFSSLLNSLTSGLDSH